MYFHRNAKTKHTGYKCTCTYSDDAVGQFVLATRADEFRLGDGDVTVRARRRRLLLLRFVGTSVTTTNDQRLLQLCLTSRITICTTTMCQYYLDTTVQAITDVVSQALTDNANGRTNERTDAPDDALDLLLVLEVDAVAVLGPHQHGGVAER